MWVRMIGIVCVMTGCLCAGWWYRLRYTDRVHTLRECQRALSILRGEICYGRTPMPEACLEVAKRTQGVVSCFFAEIYDSLGSSDISMMDIWQSASVDIFTSAHMDECDREEWIRLGSTMGYLDVDLQLRMIDLYQERLKLAIECAHQKRDCAGRLYPILGASFGALICLVLM